MKLHRFFLIAVIMLLVGPVMAQVLEPPGNVVDVVTNIGEYMGSLLGLSFLAVWVTGLLNGFLKVEVKLLRQLISWLVPIVIALVLGTLLNIGFLGPEKWHIAVLYGLGAGLVSNGIFDILFIESAVKWLENKIKGT